MNFKQLTIHTPYITLGDFLKWTGEVQTGGEAKRLIQEAQVRVNRTVETRRGRKLYPGDHVSVTSGSEWELQKGEEL